MTCSTWTASRTRVCSPTARVAGGNAPQLGAMAERRERATPARRRREPRAGRWVTIDRTGRYAWHDPRINYRAAAGAAAGDRRVAGDEGQGLARADLIPVLSARENIQYALYLARPDLTAKQQEQLVDEALDVTNLEERKNLRPGESVEGSASAQQSRERS